MKHLKTHKSGGKKKIILNRTIDLYIVQLILCKMASEIAFCNLTRIAIITFPFSHLSIFIADSVMFHPQVKW